MTEVIEKQLAELNLDRSDWQLVKFGDVAIQQKQTVDRENTELTRYVKGEHMYSEDIHLREWGELKDEYLGPAFIRKFEEGDILYGSRRTYLRKVVIAPFEGITSNTTFVIKPNEVKIDKRLLPFIMLSEGFSQNSIKNSKGSVNPYVNWKDLAGYEFLLPPLSKQNQLVELFLKSDDSIQSIIEVGRSLDSLLQSNEADFFINEKKYEVRLGSLVEKLLSGGTPNTKNRKFYSDGSIPWLTTKYLESDYINTGEKFISEEAVKSSATKVLSKGNILAGTRVGVGKFSINEVDIAFSQDVTGLMIDKAKVNVDFLVYQLNSFVFQHKIKPFLQGTTIKGITKDDLLNLRVSLPAEYVKQKVISKKISVIKKAIADLKSKKKAIKILHKSLINQVF